jgi:hypothetical protein
MASSSRYHPHGISSCTLDFGNLNSFIDHGYPTHGILNHNYLASQLTTSTSTQRATTLLEQPRRLPLQPQLSQSKDKDISSLVYTTLMSLQFHRLRHSRCDSEGMLEYIGSSTYMADYDLL